MKNNLDSSLITNRKIIVEIRFRPLPKFLDLKGSILDSVNKLNIVSAADWSIGDSALRIADNNKDELIRNLIQIEINRLSLISTKIDSIEKFVNDFSKLYSEVKSILGAIDIERIGCRIQGTYKTKSTNFQDILDNFEKAFPNQIFLNDYPTKDLRLTVVYQNGTYHVGPVAEGDPFLKTNFQYPERKDSIGIAVDTDNYLLKTENTNLNSLPKIKDVITASLAVEKSLVENLKDF